MDEEVTKIAQENGDYEELLYSLTHTKRGEKDVRSILRN